MHRPRAATLRLLALAGDGWRSPHGEKLLLGCQWLSTLSCKSWTAHFAKRGVDPILELGTLPNEHHPRARQDALVPQDAGEVGRQFLRRFLTGAQAGLTLLAVRRSLLAQLKSARARLHALCAGGVVSQALTGTTG